MTWKPNRWAITIRLRGIAFRRTWTSTALSSNGRLRASSKADALAQSRGRKYTQEGSVLSSSSGPFSCPLGLQLWTIHGGCSMSGFVALQKRAKALVVFDEERQLRVLVLLVGLGRSTGTEVDGGDAVLGEAGDVRPGLLWAHFHIAGDEALDEGVIQVDRPARGEVRHLVPCPAPGLL